MLHLRSLTGLSIHLLCGNEIQIDLVNRLSSERKVNGNFGTSKCEYFEGPLGDVRINFPGTFLERQIRTSYGRHFRTSPGRQIGTPPERQTRTSPGLSNRIFRESPGEVGGRRPRGQYLLAGTKTDATVSNTYQIQLKKVFDAGKIQKQLPQVFCKRRSTALLKKGSSIAKFLRTPIQKNICERLPLKINNKFSEGGVLF